MRGTKVVLWRQNDFNSLNNAVFFEGRAGQECPGYLFVPRVIPARPPPTAFRSPPLSMSFSAAPSKTTCNDPCESLSMKQPPRTIRIPCHGSTWTGMDQSKIPAPASAHSLSHFPVTPEIPPQKKKLAIIRVIPRQKNLAPSQPRCDPREKKTAFQVLITQLTTEH